MRGLTRYYTVALHSIRVSHLVPERYALEGLLHDAHEALVGDVPTPAKHAIRRLTGFDFRKFEDMVGGAMRVGLGLPRSVDEEALAAIRKADEQALLEEVPTVFLPSGVLAWLRLGYDIDPTFSYKQIPTPEKTKEAFIARWRQLTAKSADCGTEPVR